MEQLVDRAKKIIEKIDLEEKKSAISQIEKESSNPNFWKNPQEASSKMKELAKLQEELSDLEKLQDAVSSSNEKELNSLVDKLEELLYFSGVYDKNSAILGLHSGQGGVEAMDWTQMLCRMYTRYFDKKGWEYETIEETPGEEAGLKSITISVNGNYAYGFLKYEAGVHRLVRQSPFNADKLRQTSFALVEVLPLIEEDTAQPIKEEDLKWEFYRSGGHGGQNVNKVSTAVRLTHIPTGITVTAQSERYQGQNREYALKILKAKLWQVEEEERKKEEAKLKGGYKTPGWGNQIRSYILHPYKMVKDLRTGYESGNPDAILDGEIDEFIDEELRKL